MSNHREQISVPLPPELREFVREQARREYTSEAAVVRRAVAAAARQDSRGDRAA
jgi:Arc/MetJ-type ribon-helix-helix transcriptional regulator